jgi:hypothetical protein
MNRNTLNMSCSNGDELLNGGRIVGDFSKQSSVARSPSPQSDIVPVVTSGGIENLLEKAGLHSGYGAALRQGLSGVIGDPVIESLLRERTHYSELVYAQGTSDIGTRIQALGYVYGLALMQKHDAALVRSLLESGVVAPGPQAVADALTHFASEILFNPARVQPIVAALLYNESKNRTSLTEKRLLAGIVEPLATGLERCAASQWTSGLFLPRPWNCVLDPYLPRSPIVARGRIDATVEKLLNSQSAERHASLFEVNLFDHPELEFCLTVRDQCIFLSECEGFLSQDPVLSDRDAKMILSKLNPPVNWGASRERTTESQFKNSLPCKAVNLVNQLNGRRFSADNFEPSDLAVILFTFAQVGIVYNPQEFSNTLDEGLKLLEETYKWRRYTTDYRAYVRATLQKCYSRALED